MTAKKQVLNAIQRLPAKASFRRIVEEIELLAALREAEEDINHGRGHTLDEVRKMIPAWTSRSSSPKRRRTT
jgi:hypothetical protein